MPSTRKGQTAMAVLGALTTDPYMAQAGMIPLQHRPRVQNIGQGFVERDGEFFRVPGYEQALEAEAQRSLASRRQALTEALEMDLEKQRRSTEIPTRGDATKARQLGAYIPRLAKLGTELQLGGFDIPTGAETAAAGTRSIPVVGEAGAAAIERAGMKPEAVDWLAKGRQAESDIIRLAAGANLTGIEEQNAKMWSPWARGLTNQERLNRLENLINKFGSEAAGFMNETWQDMEFEPIAPTRPAGAAAPAAPAASAAPTGLAVGTVEEGYRFLGGNPADPKSWERVR